MADFVSFAPVMADVRAAWPQSDALANTISSFGDVLSRFGEDAEMGPAKQALADIRRVDRKDEPIRSAAYIFQAASAAYAKKADAPSNFLWNVVDRFTGERVVLHSKAFGCLLMAAACHKFLGSDQTATERMEEAQRRLNRFLDSYLDAQPDYYDVVEETSEFKLLYELATGRSVSFSPDTKSLTHGTLSFSTGVMTCSKCKTTFRARGAKPCRHCNSLICPKTECRDRINQAHIRSMAN